MPSATALAGYDFEVIGSGRAWPLDSPAFDVMHQTWVREPATACTASTSSGSRNATARGSAVATRRSGCRTSRSSAGPRTASPTWSPEIVLLFKAKHSAEPKNQADFAGALPLLDAAAAGWLRWALARVHPGHAWLSALAASMSVWPEASR